jgi:long-chain acyl-CoA synthetase
LNIANLGDAISRTDPDATALIDLGANGGPRTYSFRQLDEWCDAVARGLLAKGSQIGDRIAIVSANRAEYLAAFLGAMRAGLVPVPVNIKLPPAGVQYIIRDSGARLALLDAERMETCSTDVPRICFDGTRVCSDRDGEGTFAALLSPGEFQAVRPQPRQPAMFLYTSGSTGQPKGVVLSHASHLWVLDKRRRSPATERQRVLVAAPLYHMNALSTSHAALAQGDSVVLLPGFTVSRYLDAIAQYRCTSLTAVPTMLAMLLQQRDLLLSTALSSVKTIRMGSAPVSPGLYHSLRAQFPDAQISNVYGTTEAGPIGFGPHPKGLATPPGSLGYPHAEVQFRLSGEGVLAIKCPALMNEYHNLPDLTGAALTPDGYYITGDVFRRDENGFFYFVGRTDDMFVCGGENVYPGEVERMLERHPSVQQACVVAIPDEIKWRKPVAFVVTRPGDAVTEQELKQYTLLNGPAYQHPRRIWFLEELPLSGTNKIDKHALSQWAMGHLKDRETA